MRTLLIAGLLVLPVLTGCQTSERTAQNSPIANRVVAKADAQREAATLDRVKSLAGEWVMADGEHAGQTAAVFAVSSGGSVVREIMFPGSAHEMTNLYHLDGPDLLVTHYCAAGNQPRMRCTSPGTGRLDFYSDGVTNLIDANKEYMAELSLIFNADGTITQEWRSMIGGKVTSHAVFQLKRKS
jgi:hypothetical protein